MTATAPQVLRRWRDDPVAFVREAFRAEPDAWQAEVLRAFPKHTRLAMLACKGPGKSCVLAWLVWNFLATRLHPKVACVSITADNLRDGLWAELALWQGRSPFLKAAFTWSATRITANDHPETWWATARAWARGSDASQQADALAGLHADNLLFVIDEAGGVPDAVAAAAEAGLANMMDPGRQDAHLVIAGNPTTLAGPLYRAATSERALWHLTKITSDPDDPNRTPRVPVAWAREQIEKYGKDNPWVLVNVFGRFPPGSFNSLLGPDEVEPCLGRHLPAEVYQHAPRIIGVDIAGYGDDRTVLFPRQGSAALMPVIMRQASQAQIAARVAHAIQRWQADAVFVDCTGGYGGGVVEQLIQAGHCVFPVQFAGKPMDQQYLNKRAEMWFLMAEWIKRSPVSLPAGLTELVKELTTPTYEFQQGRFKLEAKDDIKARMGWSPDLADALALTFAMPVAPGPRLALADGEPAPVPLSGGGGVGRAVTAEG